MDAPALFVLFKQLFASDDKSRLGIDAEDVLHHDVNGSNLGDAAFLRSSCKRDITFSNTNDVGQLGFACLGADLVVGRLDVVLRVRAEEAAPCVRSSATS